MNEVIQSTDRLTALLEEQAACGERIMAILDKYYEYEYCKSARCKVAVPRICFYTWEDSQK